MNMTAKGLLSGMMSRGVDLSVQDGELKVNAPKGILNQADLDELRRLKTEIINALTDAFKEVLFEHDERRAIAEIDGKLSAEEAEKLAIKRVLRPFLQPNGQLVIPFDSDPKYHWWKDEKMNLSEIKKETEGIIGPWHLILKRNNHEAN